jgi:hypothetical protein
MKMKPITPPEKGGIGMSAGAYGSCTQGLAYHEAMNAKEEKFRTEVKNFCSECAEYCEGFCTMPLYSEYKDKWGVKRKKRNFCPAIEKYGRGLEVSDLLAKQV